MSVRRALIEQIKNIVPDEVHVIDYEDNKDVLDKVTIMVKQRALSPLTEAPIGALRVDYVITVTHPATDPAISEPELDEFVPSFVADLSALSWFGWSTATKVLDGQNLSYDIDAYVIATPTGGELPTATPEEED